MQIKKANGGIKVTPELGGLKLQEHGQDVRYRNVWVREIKIIQQSLQVRHPKKAFLGF